MARDAVAEVHTPRKIRGRAIGVVGESGEEAADASDGDAEGERDGVEISGGGAESDVVFREFDGEEASDESADDGLASHEKRRVVQILQRELRVFEPVEELRSECRSGDGGGDRGPAERSDDGISEAAAQPEVELEGDEVGEGFEEEMRMQTVVAEVEVDRERRGIGGWSDCELYVGSRGGKSKSFNTEGTEGMGGFKALTVAAGIRKLWSFDWAARRTQTYML